MNDYALSGKKMPDRARARNRGIAEAKGELIAFLDADDEWLPTYLERSVSTLHDRPSVAAVVSGYLQGPEGASNAAYWRRRGLSGGEVRISPTSAANDLITLLAYMDPWATVARRSVLRRFHGFYENGCRHGEDNYLWLKVLLNETVNETVYVESDPLVHWHDESSALSRNLNGPRPVEPFLSDPEGLYSCSPPALRTLLHNVLAIRAGKTAAMLSFWGRWREGRDLARRFAR